MRKLVKEHYLLILFFIAIILFAVFNSNLVEKNNDRMNTIKMEERG